MAEVAAAGHDEAAVRGPAEEDEAAHRAAKRRRMNHDVNVPEQPLEQLRRENEQLYEQLEYLRGQLDRHERGPAADLSPLEEVIRPIRFADPEDGSTYYLCPNPEAFEIDYYTRKGSGNVSVVFSRRAPTVAELRAIPRFGEHVRWRSFRHLT